MDYPVVAAILETQVTFIAFSSHMVQMKCREASADLSFCLTRLHCAACRPSSSSTSAAVIPLSQSSHPHSLHFQREFHTNYWQIPPFRTCLPPTCLPLKEDLLTAQWSTICQWLGLQPTSICFLVLCVLACNSTYLNRWDIFKCLNEVFFIHSTCSLFGCWHTNEKAFSIFLSTRKSIKKPPAIKTPNQEKVHYPCSRRVLQM